VARRAPHRMLIRLFHFSGVFSSGIILINQFVQDFVFNFLQYSYGIYGMLALHATVTQMASGNLRATFLSTVTNLDAGQ